MLSINFTHHQSPTDSMADRAQDWRRMTDSRCKYPTSTKGRNPTFINSLMSPASCVLGRDSLLGKVLQPFLLLKKTKAWSTCPCPATHLNTHCRHILGSARQGRDGSQPCSSCHRHCRPSAVTEAAHQLNPPLITGDYNVQLKSSIYMCVYIYKLFLLPFCHNCTPLPPRAIQGDQEPHAKPLPHRVCSHHLHRTPRAVAFLGFFPTPSARA